jgi:hypothetical protein
VNPSEADKVYLLRQLVLAISNAIDKRIAEGKPGLPPWREQHRAECRRRRREARP